MSHISFETRKRYTTKLVPHFPQFFIFRLYLLLSIASYRPVLFLLIEPLFVPHPHLNLNQTFIGAIEKKASSTGLHNYLLPMTLSQQEVVVTASISTPAQEEVFYKLW